MGPGQARQWPIVPWPAPATPWTGGEPDVRLPRRASAAAVDHLRQRVVGALELDDGFLDLALLLLEMGDLLHALLARQLQLLVRTGVVALVGLDHFRDLGQREAEALALEDELQAHAVRGAVETGEPFATRREEALVLVEAQGAQGDVELAREVSDRVDGRARLGGLGVILDPEDVVVIVASHECLPFHILLHPRSRGNLIRGWDPCYRILRVWGRYTGHSDTLLTVRAGQHAPSSNAYNHLESDS